MKTLLVIGGSGFFGKSILDAYGRGRLAPWDIGRIIVVGRSADRFNAFPALHSPGVEFLRADITTAETLPAADIVIHAAASTDEASYRENPDAESRNVHAGTANYCRIARQYHRASQIVYVSSGAVYGVQAPDIYGVPEVLSEASIASMPDGKRQYAIAKRQSEQIVQTLAQDGLAVSIARCFAFVGRWLPRNQHFAIGNFIEDGLQGRPVTVKARTPVYRSYMHADDLVTWLMTIAAHAAPMENTAAGCPVYNVGSPEAVLMGDLAKMVADCFGVAAQVPILADLEQGIDRYVPSIAKASAELGLTLEYDLAGALAATIASIKN